MQSSLLDCRGRSCRLSTGCFSRGCMRIPTQTEVISNAADAILHHGKVATMNSKQAEPICCIACLKRFVVDHRPKRARQPWVGDTTDTAPSEKASALIPNAWSNRARLYSKAAFTP